MPRTIPASAVAIARPLAGQIGHELFRRDAVWLYVYYPKDIYLNNAWVRNTKRHGISKATLKYIRIDPELRAEKQVQWNQPVTWPIWAGAIAVIGLFTPGVVAYRRRQNATAREG
jgi:hypothetical protein